MSVRGIFQIENCFVNYENPVTNSHQRNSLIILPKRIKNFTFARGSRYNNFTLIRSKNE